MNLYIKQKVFSWSDKFTIWDEHGRERWYAQGEIFTLGRKLHVLNAQGEECAFIRRKLISFLQRYYIEIGNDVYTLVKEFTLLSPRYRLENTDWSVTGDFLAHEYEVETPSERIMSFSKQWMSWGDTYQLDIAQRSDELLALCVALAIDCMTADRQSRRRW
jgi:uncharacterized protein YxjI